MNVVVTGSTGFIGRWFRRVCAQARVPVIPVSRSPQADSGLHVSDFTEPRSLLPEERQGEDFTLVHLAWATDRSPACAVHAEQVACLARLLDYWTGRGLGRLIVAGSAEEYGCRGGQLHETDSPVQPLSPYGWGKRAACVLSHAWSERNGIPVLWLRPFIVYGPGQQGNMLIPYALRQALSGSPATFSDGQQLRDFVYVEDVALAFLAALTCPANGFCSINLGTGQGTAVVDVLQYLADSIRPRPVFRLGALARRAGEPAEQVANIQRATTLLGWHPQVSWREGLKRLVLAAGAEQGLAEESRW